jgi:hypothetical protein
MNYKYYNDSDIVVVLTDAAGVDTTQTILTHYALSNKAEDAHDQTLGRVTMVTAPAGGGTPELLTIYRKPALTQLLTLLTTGGWYSIPVEQQLDLIIMIFQEHQLRLDRCAQNAITNLTPPISLEALMLAAGAGLISDLPGLGTLADADLFRVGDDSDSGIEKKLAASAAWTYMLTKIAANAVVGKIITFGAEVANTGTTPTIDWGAGQKQKLTLTGNTTPTNPMTPPAGPCNLVLRVIQSSGGHTVTWPAAVKWSGGGIAPTLSTGAGEYDIISFYYDGTNYNGEAGLDYQ